MTIADFREQSALYPDDTVLYAFDGDLDEKMPVTGLLFDPRRGPDEPPTMQFQTDEP